MKQFIKRFEVFGITERQKGSGRLRTAATPENEKAVGEWFVLKKIMPELMCPKNILPKDSILCILSIQSSQSSVRRLIKKGTKQSKRLKLPYMNDATRKWKVERAGCLFEKFETNPGMIERAVFQDESDFPLQIPINSQNDRVQGSKERCSR